LPSQFPNRNPTLREYSQEREQDRRAGTLAASLDSPRRKDRDLK
jgi:hypothetical protein